MQQKTNRTIAENRKAYHDYFVLEKYEAGISLAGTEVKSVRAGNVNLKDAWCDVDKGVLLLKGVHISPYEQGNIFNQDPRRDRPLLMHKNEIMKLFGRIKQEGLTLIPLSLYFKNGRIKAEIGLCKGKKLHDKRDTEARKSADRDIERGLKERY
ncbi:MAG TPA: SsrA-binding protein SmpB [Oscillospiraceae bacterium]|nr:SsrA-binding protein SmpB [Oscillospiraceae bacterium]HPF55217.1 SsrA-binding protein SmpB [Clostridiales bacterium]HPK36037.1 SsrA-binding protein SmpB [Oscillospiraceae bacterium]HPR75968.1 SsrA-binding protein SmpB [Oscillospiraceae bacterium]